MRKLASILEKNRKLLFILTQLHTLAISLVLGLTISIEIPHHRPRLLMSTVNNTNPANHGTIPILISTLSSTRGSAQ